MGWIGCPIKGIECKELGDNCFLFTFLQASRKRRALDDGPWMISKELLVVVDFDGSKSLDEVDFSSIPIWVRIGRLLMGLMNKAVAETLGDEIRSFMEVDCENDDLAAGRFLRVKVRLDIRQPLRQGLVVEVGEGGGDRWCPLQYEYLPDFCCVCGIIGHTDKMCSKKIAAGEKAPFNKDLRYIHY
jgi:hypothetical protein